MRQLIYQRNLSVFIIVLLKKRQPQQKYIAKNSQRDIGQRCKKRRRSKYTSTSAEFQWHLKRSMVVET